MVHESLVEKVGDRGTGAQRLRVRPEHQPSGNFQRRALAAVGAFAGQGHARRDLEPRIDVGEANPQREDGGSVGRHRHVFRHDALDQAGRGEGRIVEWIGRRIAWIIGRRRWLRCRFVGGGLHQYRGDVGAGLAVPLQPSVHLALGGRPFPCGGPSGEQANSCAKCCAGVFFFRWTRMMTWINAFSARFRSDRRQLDRRRRWDACRARA